MDCSTPGFPVLPSPGTWSNSCPLCWWCYPTISSSVIPFSSCPQSFPASGSFPMSQLFASGGQSIGISASASVFPMNVQDWFPLGSIGWISLLSKGLLGVFSVTSKLFKIIQFLRKKEKKESLCLPLLPQIPPSIRVFSNESALYMRWPKYWSVSLSMDSHAFYKLHLPFFPVESE